ncbi:MAG TPA: flagella basal body P-ring formation protein FlgA [Chloroflexota bacterium]|nr:flagella basal body P-ring formation protein FlgA [Chloroflexota bacterium]HUM68099.1 flagella basal body P-ring formation protein FlgA [Chloroflexota bacterium]
MSRRTIAILILIIGLGLLTLVGVFLIQGQNQPTTAPPTEEAITEGDDGAPAPDSGVGISPPETVGTPMPTDTIGVVVSLQTVPRGHIMTEDILAIDRRPVDSVDSNVITDTKDVIGMFARTDIYQGQTLTKDKLAGDIREIVTSEYGPSSLIPPGFVAQAIPLSTFRLDSRGSIASVGYGVSEGDYVDILLLFDMRQIDEEFQTLLPNDLALFITVENEETQEKRFLEIDPYGYFEELPTGDTVHVRPREFQRPYIVGLVIQNAKVIQVGQYMLPETAASQLATATPTPLSEGDPTPLPEPIAAPTATPSPPEVLVVALQPQQQLLLRYALEVGADVDFALRGINDGQLYPVQNVDLNFLLDRFNIEIPPNFGYTLDTRYYNITPTPTPDESGFTGGEG